MHVLPQRPETEGMRLIWETSSTMSDCRDHSIKGIRSLAGLWHLPDFWTLNWNYVNLNKSDAFEDFNVPFRKLSAKFLTSIFLKYKILRPLKVKSTVNLKKHSVFTRYCVPLFSNTSIISVHCCKIHKLLLIWKERKILNLFTFFEERTIILVVLVR